MNTYQELVAKKLISVWAKHVCSSSLKEDVVCKFETLADGELQINISVFFVFWHKLSHWTLGKFINWFPFPSRFTFKFLFRFKRAFLLKIFEFFFLLSTVKNTPEDYNIPSLIHDIPSLSLVKNWNDLLMIQSGFSELGKTFRFRWKKYTANTIYQGFTRCWN